MEIALRSHFDNMADSPAYGQRVRAKALRQTLRFTKTKLLVAVIMTVILSIARWVFRRVQATYRDLFWDIGIVIGCYVFVSIVAYLWNLFCAPALLDKERQEEITSLATRAQIAEIAANSIESRKILIADFSILMREGKAIADRIPHLSGEQLAGWESELESWKQRVTAFMNTAGWQTEVVPFLQAGDKAEPVQGIDNLGLKRERRRRRMTFYNQKLDDVAQRRIASAQ
jgi:hypothetical protein